MENAKYIYIQIAQDIHEDRERILTSSDHITETIYIADLTSEELAIYNQFVSMMNDRLSNPPN
jgi:hypothetical protein